METTADQPELTFRSPLFRAEAADAWRFVALPADVSEAVRLVAGPPRGFGSVRVQVRIGATTWRTSVFPDAARGTFVLPVKRAVRAAEGLEDGDVVEVALEVSEP